MRNPTLCKRERGRPTRYQRVRLSEPAAPISCTSEPSAGGLPTFPPRLSFRARRRGGGEVSATIYFTSVVLVIWSVGTRWAGNCTGIPVLKRKSTEVRAAVIQLKLELQPPPYGDGDR